MRLLEEIASDQNNRIKLISGRVGIDKICASCMHNKEGTCMEEYGASSADETDAYVFRIVEGRRYVPLVDGDVRTVRRLSRLRIVKPRE
jgi:hypothetical protein